NRYVEATDLVDRVVVDLGEDDLLSHAHRVVAAPVEGARVQPAEVADSRDRDRDQAIEELIAALTAQRHGEPDGHALAKFERRNRLARAAHARLLTGDRRELLARGFEHFGVLLGLTDPHVEGDLLHARSLHDRGVAEALHQLRADLLQVAGLHPRRGRLSVGRAHAVLIPAWRRCSWRVRRKRGPSQHLRRKGDDLHEVALAQFTSDWPEHARATGIVLLVDDHRRVLVEGDVGPIFAADRLLGADDDRRDDVALLDGALGICLLDGRRDDIADERVAAPRAALDPDAQDLARSRVVGDAPARLV